MWDCESGAFERTLKGHTSTVNDACFNAKGTVLASCSADMSVKLWDFEKSYECIRTLRGHEHNVCGVCWAQSDELLVSASRDTTLRVWEVARAPRASWRLLCVQACGCFVRILLHAFSLFSLRTLCWQAYISGAMPACPV